MENRIIKGLAKNTKVIMSDGTIKYIQDVIIGDQLMGYDSLPRTVLSTYSDISPIYEVKPSKGSSIYLSFNHNISVKGLNPALKRDLKRPKTYVVVWATKGIQTSKYFSTEQEAISFMEQLPKEEIFDLSINNWTNMLNNQKAHCYLYHTGLYFEEKEVPFDPYMLGYWLGDGTSASSEITTADPEIVAYFKENLTKYNLKFVSIGKSKDIRYNISNSLNYNSPRCNVLLIH